MHDPLIVRVVEGCCHLSNQTTHLARGHRLAEQLGERSRFHKLHDNVSGIVFLAVVDHNQDVGVAKACDSLCLLSETLQECLILFSVVRRHDFHRDVPIERRLIGFVDRGHTALADLRDDPVATYFFSD